MKGKTKKSRGMKKGESECKYGKRMVWNKKKERNDIEQKKERDKEKKERDSIE